MQLLQIRVKITLRPLFDLKIEINIEVIKNLQKKIWKIIWGDLMVIFN
jgi:hypothetical protein